MEVTLPVRAQDLKHHIKNLAGLVGHCLGQTSLLHIGLTDLVDHVEEKGGSGICNRFHSVGFCFSDCRNAHSHRKLNLSEADSFRKFLRSARENRVKFEQKRGPKGSNPGREEGNRELTGLEVSPESNSGA